MGPGIVVQKRILNTWRVRILRMGRIRVMVILGITIQHPAVWRVLIAFHIPGGHIVDGESLGNVAVHSLTVQSDCHAMKLLDGMNRAVSPIEPVTVCGGTVGQDIHDGVLVGDFVERATPLHSPIVGNSGQSDRSTGRIVYFSAS